MIKLHQLRFDRVTRDIRVVWLRKVELQDELLLQVLRIGTLITHKDLQAQAWLPNLDNRLMVMVLCKDQIVDEWSVVKDVKSKTQNRMQFVLTRLGVEIKIRPSKCKDTKLMIRVWQVQAVMFSLTWMEDSPCKAWMETLNNKWVQIISRRSSRREKQLQRTRLKRLIVHESRCLLQNFQTVPTTWIVWASQAMLASKIPSLWTLTSSIRVVQLLRTITQLWLIEVWTISLC